MFGSSQIVVWLSSLGLGRVVWCWRLWPFSEGMSKFLVCGVRAKFGTSSMVGAAEYL